jgi:hypothetical protein
MATKKKKSKKKAVRKATTKAASKKRTPKVKVAKKSTKTSSSSKSHAGKKLAGKTLVAKKKSSKIGSAKTGRSEKAPAVRTRNKTRGQSESSPSDMLGPDSAGQSGDLQGLSNAEGADSESVDELIEEGNAFEAGIVAGVEESGERGMKEVRTREFPEDDVPGEYLDEE